jgi:hypothetical protein
LATLNFDLDGGSRERAGKAAASDDAEIYSVGAILHMAP